MLPDARVGKDEGADVDLPSGSKDHHVEECPKADAEEEIDGGSWMPLHDLEEVEEYGEHLWCSGAAL